MSDRRTQGRPSRGSSEVGKERILVALRDLLRAEQGSDLSRKRLAEYAGVTPALISYYFPKKDVLLEEAVAPVVAGYRAEMSSILQDAAPIDSKLKKVISLLLRLYGHDGKIFDLYNEMAQKAGNGSKDEIVRMTALLTSFFDQEQDRNVPHQFDAAVLQGAIWGMCRFAANTEIGLQTKTANNNKATDLAETLFSVFTFSLSGKYRIAKTYDFEPV